MELAKSNWNRENIEGICERQEVQILSLGLNPLCQLEDDQKERTELDSLWVLLSGMPNNCEDISIIL